MNRTALSVSNEGYAAESLWQAQFAEMSSQRRLQHFQQRRGIAVFPRVDQDQAPPQQLRRMLHGEFEFNGEMHALGREPDWLRNPSTDIEWHILLHKFYYAPGLVALATEANQAEYVDRWLELTRSWMRAVPPGFIAADVTGRRVQNWIYAREFAVTGPFAGRLDAAFHDDLVAAIAQQTDFLCANLTPKRNHRTLELHAIVLAGVALPELARAGYWREFGLTQLIENLRADLLPDGVHCELSTDYHHLALRNFLSARRLILANGGTVPAAMDELLQRALDFSMHAHNPLGIVPSFSDGDARSHLDLLALGADCFNRSDYRYVATQGQSGELPGLRSASFETAGYYIVRSGWGQTRAFADEHHLIFDCGPLGEGNHGHLDALSFELTAGGRRLIADPGRYTYSEAGDINWRVMFRGTPAHNTVTVDGRQQTRYAPKPAVAGGRHPTGQLRHRILGPAPRTQLHGRLDRDDCFILSGSAHSAEYPVQHERSIVFLANRLWLIVDRLRAAESHRYQSTLQLAPGAGDDGILGYGEGCQNWLGKDWQILCAQADATLRLEAGWVSDTYGSKLPAPRWVLTAEASDCWMHALIDPEARGGVRLRQLSRPQDDRCLLQVAIATGRGAGFTYNVSIQPMDESNGLVAVEKLDTSGHLLQRWSCP